MIIPVGSRNVWELFVTWARGEGGGCLSGQGGVHRVHRRSRVIPWRIGDRVRRAIAHAWTLNEAPTIDEVRQRAQGWAPGRGYATALFWRSLTTTEGIPA